MSVNLGKARILLQAFDFRALFIDELGWNKPALDRAEREGRNMFPPAPELAGAETWNQGGVDYTRKEIASLAGGGVVIFEVTAADGSIPDKKALAAIHAEISKLHHENLLIFIDSQRSQSVWYWVKRDGPKKHPRDHIYIKGQPGDLFLGKLASMFVDISELDERGNLPVTEVAQRLKKALDVERVTKKFYNEFQLQHIEFLALIKGIDDDRQLRWYASILLNRLMFIYFLQRKGFLDNGNQDYLQNKLGECQKAHGKDNYYGVFLKALFFEGFAKPEEGRTPEARKILGKIKYLNGGLFLPHKIETDNPDIKVPDKAFENLFKLFSSYSWNLDDTPGGNDNEINPDVLGYIFEKYINQKAFGAYYTRPEITGYLCERTIHKLILDKVNSPGIPGVVTPRQFESLPDLLLKLDASLCRELLFNVLPDIKLLDPACGSGAFLVAAMRVLINVYSAIVGKISFLNDRPLKDEIKKIESEHRSINYFIKKRIITDNLYGVDIMEEATEIAKLRLFLTLVASAQSVDDLEPLPNIDFNIMAGNSLIGLLKVSDDQFSKHDVQGDMFRKRFSEVLAEKNRLVNTYKHTTKYAEDLRSLRDTIQKHRKEHYVPLDNILLDEFNDLKIKFEEATWDAEKNKEGKSKKRALAIADIEVLHPFHWGYEFDEILNTRGGFDAIITNPPWEIFKPQSKEFFAEHSDLVTKNKMTIKEFEKEQAKLMKDREIRKAWLEFLNRFPHVNQHYRTSAQYKNQISVVNGKKAGTDINLYKLFLEQCFNLLHEKGECGIVIPSGIYSDLGTKQLREMLFAQTKVTGLFCFENRKEIFEGVDSRFKFVVLTFEKGGATQSFPTAFMRHEVKELERFPKEGALELPVELIKKLSPDSLSIMELKNEMDVAIAKKMLHFPLLGEKLEGVWNLELCREFHMTDDSHLFKTESGKGRLPLYEGKMIHQFNHQFEKPQYWVNEKEGRKALLRSEADNGQKLDYQEYRIGYRSVASSTNERTLIASVLPKNHVLGHSLNATKGANEARILLYLTALFNGFTVDFSLRSRVSANLTQFYIFQLPVPRLPEKEPVFKQIVERAAKLICTTPEFDDLAKEVGLGSHKNGATDPAEREKLRAELDGIIAHLYGLTEEEFTYILTTFPIVKPGIKEAALDEYCKLANTSPLQNFIAQGEGPNLEFKETLFLNTAINKEDQKITDSSLKAVAAFLNTNGGTLLIGVADKGEIKGIERDYQFCKKGKQNDDGFELKFRDILNSRLKPYPHDKITIHFKKTPAGTVCRVDILPSPSEIHLDNDIYVRDGNRNLKLEGPDLVSWIKSKSILQSS